MDIFSAAISLLGFFICLIIFIPVILLVGLFLGYDQLTPITQAIFKGIWGVIRRLLNLPTPVETQTANRINPKKKTTKAKSSKTEAAPKPANVEDAEFRDVQS